jgi:lactobin A/cerein 7B family class IIb bacteriocin
MNTGEHSTIRELTADELNQVSGGGALFGIIAGVANALFEAGSMLHDVVKALPSPKDPWA